jgi:hypothetical protein
VDGWQGFRGYGVTEVTRSGTDKGQVRLTKDVSVRPATEMTSITFFVSLSEFIDNTSSFGLSVVE